jgi:uncharacterized protein (DUF2164 family)
MSIELSDENRDEAIASLQMYFLEERQEEMGNIAAGALLEFILTEIGPSIYNRGVRDARDRLQIRLMDVDVELTETEFPGRRRR